MNDAASREKTQKGGRTFGGVVANEYVALTVLSLIRPPLLPSPFHIFA